MSDAVAAARPVAIFVVGLASGVVVDAIVGLFPSWERQGKVKMSQRRAWYLQRTHVYTTTLRSALVYSDMETRQRVGENYEDVYIINP